MKIEVKVGDITKISADAVVVNLFQGVTVPGGATGAVDQAIGGLIRQAIQDKEFTGKLNEVLILRPTKGVLTKRVVVVGLGKQEDFTLDAVRQASASVALKLREAGLKRFATIVHGAGIGATEPGHPSSTGGRQKSRSTEWNGGLEPAEAAQAMVEGAWLGCYRFDKYQSNHQENKKTLEGFILVEKDAKKAKETENGARIGSIIGRAVCEARDLINEPSNVLTPTAMAAQAKIAAKKLRLTCKILEHADCEKLGMGSFLSVTKGSEEPPKFIVLEYRGGNEKDKWIALVGKGVTFDTGGISLKPGAGMWGMIGDMSGSAVCLKALCACAELKLPVNAVAILPMVENMPSGKATKPGDIVKAMSGKTIEVLNTDAEGRLVLADGLAYGERYQLKAIVDVATLTGAANVALGRQHAAVMGTDESVMQAVKTAATKTGERVWELPIGKEYDSLIKSDSADMKNIGDGSAGTIVGGVFLKKHLSQNAPWVHIDIAAVMGVDKDRPYGSKGMSAFGTRLLIQLLRDYSQNS